MKKTIFALIACASFLCSCAGAAPSGEGRIDLASSQSQKDSAAHEHTYSSKWSSDDTYHWHDSTCGHDSVKDKASHTFAKWEVDVQPTETSEGERHRYCSICRYKQSEAMPKVEHVHTWGEATYSWGLDYTTCTASHLCTKNLYHEEEETVNASYEVVYEPTSSSEGSGCYTAKFTNPDFATQKKYVSIPKLNVPVTGISLNRSSLEVSKGGSAYLLARLSPSNASNLNVIWSSSDESVATVSDGVVKGVDEGTATILATTEDGGYSAACEVTVTYIPVTGLSLSKEKVVLEIGEESPTIFANVSPSGASIDEVNWSLGDTSIASGKVGLFGGVTLKGVAVGETVLTAVSVDGGFTASCKIQVLEKKNLSYEVGDAAVRVYEHDSKNYVSAYVPVTNNGNVSIYVSSTGFDVEDGEGNLKQSISSYKVECSPNLIRPGETTYVYLDVEYEGDAVTGLVGLPHLSVKDASSANGIRYQVSEEITFANRAYYDGFAANGTVRNNGEKASSSIEISVLVFDKSGDYRATLTASVFDDLAPGASASFSATNWGMTRHENEFTFNDIGHYEVYACEFELVY